MSLFYHLPYGDVPADSSYPIQEVVDHNLQTVVVTRGGSAAYTVMSLTMPWDGVLFVEAGLYAYFNAAGVQAAYYSMGSDVNPTAAPTAVPSDDYRSEGATGGGAATWTTPVWGYWVRMPAGSHTIWLNVTCGLAAASLVLVEAWASARMYRGQYFGV